MTEVTKKRRTPADKESFKRLRTDINEVKESLESMSKQFLQLVEYLTVTEMRIQQLELIMDNQGEALKALQSPPNPYITWSTEFDRDEFKLTPSDVSGSDSDLNIDQLSFDEDCHPLLEMSPLSLEEHPGTILNLLCNEVMD